jgi:hypothetical protein
VDLLDLSRDVGFLILWQAKTSLTVLQTAVLAHSHVHNLSFFKP